MKILKLVLIAIVTVSIYSFTTTNEKQIEFPDNNGIVKVDHYDGCVTITFKRDSSGNYNKSLGREYAFYMLRGRAISVGPLFEQGLDYERYYYNILDTTQVGATSNTNNGSTSGPEDGSANYWDRIKDGVYYATYGVGGCDSAMITNLN
jgi:hypothetical protein